MGKPRKKKSETQEEFEERLADWEWKTKGRRGPPGALCLHIPDDVVLKPGDSFDTSSDDDMTPGAWVDRPYPYETE